MTYLTEEMIQQNKEAFIALINSISRDGAKIEQLLTKLENSDFYTAPASTKYHSSFKGGLVYHCLNVYHNLMELVNMKGLNDEISTETIVIVSLLHDLSKMNFYQLSTRNKKVYSPQGKKQDEIGKFDWVTEQSYATLPQEERFMIGNHEENSEYMARYFVPLTVEESAAILNHHGGLGSDSTQGVAPKIMGKFKLVTLLHLADMLAAYCDEEIKHE